MTEGYFLGAVEVMFGEGLFANGRPDGCDRVGIKRSSQHIDGKKSWCPDAVRRRGSGLEAPASDVHVVLRLSETPTLQNISSVCPRVRPPSRARGRCPD